MRCSEADVIESLGNYKILIKNRIYSFYNTKMSAVQPNPPST